MTDTGPFLEFGEWLKQRRLAARLKSQPQAVQRARTLRLKLVTQGKLSHLERGLNANPAPELLRELAKLYGVPFEEVVRKWTTVRFGSTAQPASDTPPLSPVESDVVRLLRRLTEQEQDFFIEWLIVRTGEEPQVSRSPAGGFRRSKTPSAGKAGRQTRT